MGALLLLACETASDLSGGGETATPTSRAFPSWTDMAGEMGLSAIDLGSPLAATGQMGAGLAPILVDDVNADGSLDIVTTGLTRTPTIYLNRGDSTFEAGLSLAEAPASAEPMFNLVVALVGTDLDSDGHVDVLGFTPNAVILWPGLGDAQFGEPETIYTQSDEPPALHITAAVGDLDGNGLLDIVLPGLGYAGGSPGDPLGILPAPTTLLYQFAGHFEAQQPFADASSLLAVRLTDRDRDGDLDLLAPPDHELETRFWRNDGGTPPLWNDDAAEVGAQLRMAAMGIATADLNADGVLDHCITHTGSPRCLLSQSSGGWAESGAAIGLVPAQPGTQSFSTVGWGMVMADLDNDGDTDVFQASGPHGDAATPPAEPWPDLAWEGQDGTFTDVSARSGLDTDHAHFGAIAADVDGNGALEIIVAGYDEAPHVYRSEPPPSGHWVTFDLVGPEGNRSAVGALVEVEAGGSVWLRETATLAGPGAGPRRIHVGLGEVEQVEGVTVYWPAAPSERYEGVTVDQLNELRQGEGTTP